MAIAIPKRKERGTIFVKAQGINGYYSFNTHTGARIKIYAGETLPIRIGQDELRFDEELLYHYQHTFVVKGISFFLQKPDGSILDSVSLADIKRLKEDQEKELEDLKRRMDEYEKASRQVIEQPLQPAQDEVKEDEVPESFGTAIDNQPTPEETKPEEQTVEVAMESEVQLAGFKSNSKKHSKKTESA